MKSKLPIKRHIPVALIVAASILVVGGVAVGTMYTLKQMVPVEMTDESKNQEPTKSPIDQASELMSKGDYAGAKNAYENILETYKAQNNEAGVRDMEMQLQVVEATANAPKEPVNSQENATPSGPRPE